MCALSMYFYAIHTSTFHSAFIYTQFFPNYTTISSIESARKLTATSCIFMHNYNQTDAILHVLLFIFNWFNEAFYQWIASLTTFIQWAKQRDSITTRQTYGVHFQDQCGWFRLFFHLALFNFVVGIYERDQNEARFVFKTIYEIGLRH